MLALLGVGLLPRRQLRSPLLTALRVFFPSWRFFGAPGLEVELRVRTVDAEGTVSAWRDALTLARRPWHAVIWNPPATLRWSESSLVRDLLEQLEELEEVSIETIERLARFKLVDHLARSSLTTSPPPSVHHVKRERDGDKRRGEARVEETHRGEKLEEDHAPAGDDTPSAGANDLRDGSRR